MTKRALPARTVPLHPRVSPLAHLIPRSLPTLLCYVVAALIALLMVFPFLWMLSTSFKPIDETIRFPPTIIPERTVWFENYQYVIGRTDFARYFFNSMVVSLSVTAATLFTSALAGYIFAKFTFRGRDTLFFLIITTIMVPFHVILIPVFLIVRSLGLYNTLGALIVPGLVSAWGIFLMRQQMASIPSELLDAARMDGASEWGVFLRIVLPLVRPGLAALGVFVFMHTWNDFLWPLIVIDNEQTRTLPLGLALFSSGFGISRWNLVMAGAVLSILPVLLCFLLLQRHLIRGVTLGGLKG